MVGNNGMPKVDAKYIDGSRRYIRISSDPDG